MLTEKKLLALSIRYLKEKDLWLKVINEHKRQQMVVPRHRLSEIGSFKHCVEKSIHIIVENNCISCPSFLNKAAKGWNFDDSTDGRKFWMDVMNDMVRYLKSNGI